MPNYCNIVREEPLKSIQRHIAGLFGAITSTNLVELGVLAVQTVAMFVLAAVAFRRIYV